MPDPSTDQRFMRHALDLGRAGVGMASPNPHVGAVIVNEAGELLGVGSHTYDGLKHAEILALDQAGETARGATLYVNLEPCSHRGRTGPCADAVVAAGIRRVVASMPDPNPQVSGKGFARLKDAGIVVDVGLMENEARQLNESFARYIQSRIPLVTLKTAMTLDGKIAPPPGSPREWITGEAARAHVQQLRHQQDAIMVGIGTVITDNPLLTDRSGLPRRRPLLRVVLDSRLRLPLTSQIVTSARHDLLVFYIAADDERKREFEEKGIRVEQLASAEDGRLDMAAVLRRLGELQITSVMIEGGSELNAAALSAGIVDKIVLYYPPRVMGPGIPFTVGAAINAGAQVWSSRLHKFDDDIAIEGYLRDPYLEISR